MYAVDVRQAELRACLLFLMRVKGMLLSGTTIQKGGRRPARAGGVLPEWFNP